MDQEWEMGEEKCQEGRVRLGLTRNDERRVDERKAWGTKAELMEENAKH